MKYLINNSKPEVIVINQQKVIEYFTEAKKGKFTRYLIWIAMHPVGMRSDSGLDPEDQIDQYVVRYNLPPSEKLIINHKSEGFVKDYRYTSEQRRNINYTFSVEHYKHIVKFIIGTDQTDQRRYDLLVGVPTPIENDSDAKILTDRFYFVDECNEKGEITNPNPNIDRIDRKPMDTKDRKLPTQWEVMPREDFTQKFDIREAPKMTYKEEQVEELK
uniref:Uncharacterized protein n=1 Tax=viral metagenome TaxID=1070528 RepID=A0A6H1ZKT2_9ZZZZ